MENQSNGQADAPAQTHTPPGEGVEASAEASAKEGANESASEFGRRNPWRSAHGCATS
jgi:hypothetical protein